MNKKSLSNRYAGYPTLDRYFRQSQSKSMPEIRDGDGDGMIYDGTEHERPANPKLQKEIKKRVDAESSASSTPEAISSGEPINPDGADTMAMYRSENGEWTPERRKLHDAIVEKTLVGKTPVEKPVAYIMGGGPASGKSSVIKQSDVTIEENTVHIDSDEVKKQIPEYQEMVKAKDGNAARFAHEESSYVSKEAMRVAARGSYNVLLDGTGNGKFNSLKKKSDTMRASGQRVIAHYVTCDTEEAVRRSSERGVKTGRVVPEDFIRSNHAAVSRVVPEAIAGELFDDFTLWDTNGPQVRRVAVAKGKELTVLDKELWERFIAKGK